VLPTVEAMDYLILVLLRNSTIPSKSEAWGLGCGVWGLGGGVWSLEFGVLVSGFGVYCLVRVWGSGVWIEGSGVRGKGVGSVVRGWGSGFRVLGVRG